MSSIFINYMFPKMFMILFIHLSNLFQINGLILRLFNKLYHEIKSHYIELREIRVIIEGYSKVSTTIFTNCVTQTNIYITFVHKHKFSDAYLF